VVDPALDDVVGATSGDNAARNHVDEFDRGG